MSLLHRTQEQQRTPEPGFSGRKLYQHPHSYFTENKNTNKQTNKQKTTVKGSLSEEYIPGWTLKVWCLQLLTLEAGATLPPPADVCPASGFMTPPLHGQDKFMRPAFHLASSLSNQCASALLLLAKTTSNHKLNHWDLYSLRQPREYLGSFQRCSVSPSHSRQGPASRRRAPSRPPAPQFPCALSAHPQA